MELALLTQATARHTQEVSPVLLQQFSESTKTLLTLSQKKITYIRLNTGQLPILRTYLALDLLSPCPTVLLSIPNPALEASTFSVLSTLITQ